MNKKMLESKNLVKISDINQDIKFDLRYASKNNFTKKKLYTRPVCLLREKVAQALSKVAKNLKEYDLFLLIWDAYRPPYVQKQLRQVFDDESLIPKISDHSKGTAVDLTLCKKDGRPVKMPTGFDNFSQKAHSDFMDISQEQMKNRELLKNVMEKHSFKQSKLEWWHFDYLGIENAKVINLEI